MTAHSTATAVAALNIAELEKAGLRKMLSEAELLRIIPVSPTTLWRMWKKDRFPRPTYISPNKRVWYLDEVIKWQAEVNGRGRGRRSREQPALGTSREHEADSIA